MNKTRLLSPFCVLSCNQSSSLFSGLLCRFRYSPVERFFYKFDRIDCCPKLNAKPVNRLIHWCWQVPPPVNSATHCFFDGCYHLIDGDVAVGLRHSLAPLFRSATAETTSLAGSAAALCAHSKTRCPTSAMVTSVGSVPFATGPLSSPTAEVGADMPKPTLSTRT